MVLKCVRTIFSIAIYLAAGAFCFGLFAGTGSRVGFIIGALLNLLLGLLLMFVLAYRQEPPSTRRIFFYSFASPSLLASGWLIRDALERMAVR